MSQGGTNDIVSAALASQLCLACCLRLVASKHEPLWPIDRAAAGDTKCANCPPETEIDAANQVRQLHAAYRARRPKRTFAKPDPARYRRQYQLELKTAEVARASSHLADMQRLSILNESFHIWQVDAFGTINNCRLGRLPSRAEEQIPWFEVNRALGFLCHLTECLMRRVPTAVAGLDRYTCLPQGTRSTIRVTKEANSGFFGSGGKADIYCLHWPSPTLLPRLTSPLESFNGGLVALLEISALLASAVKGEPPYAVVGSTVGNYPVELSQGDEGM